MNNTFLQAQDWSTIFNDEMRNSCWQQILSVIDEFQLVLDSEKLQMNKLINELTQTRKQLIIHFNRFKKSLKQKGQVKKQQLPIYHNDQSKKFFSNSYPIIEQIIKKIGNKPKLLAKIISNTKQKKYINQDFLQSLLYHLYPCYIPTLINQQTPNNCLLFIEEIINHWNYDIKHCRPLSQTLIDNIIDSINKSPQIVCYVQKISLNFFKQLNNYKLQQFAFDQQAQYKSQHRIKHELIKQKQLTYSQNIQSKNIPTKIKQFFIKPQFNRADIQFASFQSFTDATFFQHDVTQVMQKRQKQFPNLITKIVYIIINQQLPPLLTHMMKFFHKKISHQLQNSPQLLDQSINNSSIYSPDNNSINNQCNQKYFQHYTYFLITNLITGQINYQFNITHQNIGMKPQKLQNFTQIISIVTKIFQGTLPKGHKYKNDKYKNLDTLYPKIYQFYNKIITNNTHQVKQRSHQQSNDSKQVHELLMNFHQHIHILSFNDIRTLLTLIKSSPHIKQLQLSSKSQKMEFITDSKISNLFNPQTKRVQFLDKKCQIQKIFFIFNHIPKLSSFLISQSPLKNYSIVTQFLQYGINQHKMFGSHLKVTDALLVTGSLRFIQTLSLKQIKYFLNKFLTQFSHLYGQSTIELNDSQLLTKQFRKTIQNNLMKLMQRKALFLLFRDSLCKRIQTTEKYIDSYINQLRNAEFYQRISQTFIQNIKIKVFLRIESDQFQIYTNTNQMKGISLQYLLSTDIQSKSKSIPQQQILRSSYKCYTSIPQLIQTLTRNRITQFALSKGRKVQQYNDMFKRLCEIITISIQQFLKKKQILQNLNITKLSKSIVSKLQYTIYKKTKKIQQNISDINFNEIIKKIDIKTFQKKDLQQFNVDWGFLLQQGKQKFAKIIHDDSIMEKIRHFQQMFRIVFAIVGFSIAKDKITAQIINPIIQYLVLKSGFPYHHQCLFLIKALKFNTTPQNSYNIILYQSTLTYIMKDMSTHYSLPNKQLLQNKQIIKQ